MSETWSDVHTAVRETIAEVLELDNVSALSLDVRLDTTFEIDSLLMADLISALEERFGVIFAEDELHGYHAVGEIIERVRHRLAIGSAEASS